MGGGFRQAWEEQLITDRVNVFLSKTEEWTANFKYQEM